MFCGSGTFYEHSTREARSSQSKVDHGLVSICVSPLLVSGHPPLSETIEHQPGFADIRRCRK